MPLYGGLYAEERFTAPQDTPRKRRRLRRGREQWRDLRSATEKYGNWTKSMDQSRQNVLQLETEPTPQKQARSWLDTATKLVWDLVKIVPKGGGPLAAAWVVMKPNPANQELPLNLLSEPVINPKVFASQKIKVPSLGDFISQGETLPTPKTAVPFLGKEYVYYSAEELLVEINQDATMEITNKLYQVAPESPTNLQIEINPKTGDLEITEIPMISPSPALQPLVAGEVPIYDIMAPKSPKGDEYMVSITATPTGEVRLAAGPAKGKDGTVYGRKRRRRRKDRKAKYRNFYGAWSKYINVTYGRYDEWMQAGQIYYNNLVYTKGPNKGKSLSEVNRYNKDFSKNMLSPSRLKFYAEAFDMHMKDELELDVVGFGLDMATNWAQDTAIGFLGSKATQAFVQNTGSLTGLQFGRALDGPRGTKWYESQKVITPKSMENHNNKIEYFKKQKQKYLLKGDPIKYNDYSKRLKELIAKGPRKTNPKRDLSEFVSPTLKPYVEKYEKFVENDFGLGKYRKKAYW